MTRTELLQEVETVWQEIEDFHHRCSETRLRNDTWYQWAYAFLWLRLTEPVSALRTQRLLGEDVSRRWSGLAKVRNALAHDRLADIDYVQLWSDFSLIQSVLPADLDQLC